MKNFTLLLIVFLLILFTSKLSAQSYNSSIGLRLGYPVSASFKMFISESGAIEATASYRRKTYGSYGYRYGWSSFGGGLAYQVHKELILDFINIEGVSWYYGAGASIYIEKSFDNDPDFDYYEKDRYTSFGIQGYIGFDYKFEEYPINMSIDWVPTIILSGFASGFGADYGALSIRYVLGGE